MPKQQETKSQSFSIDKLPICEEEKSKLRKIIDLLMLVRKQSANEEEKVTPRLWRVTDTTFIVSKVLGKGTSGGQYTDVRDGFAFQFLYGNLRVDAYLALILEIATRYSFEYFEFLEYNTVKFSKIVMESDGQYLYEMDYVSTI